MIERHDATMTQHFMNDLTKFQCLAQLNNTAIAALVLKQVLFVRARLILDMQGLYLKPR